MPARLLDPDGARALVERLEFSRVGATGTARSANPTVATQRARGASNARRLDPDGSRAHATNGSNLRDGIPARIGT